MKLTVLGSLLLVSTRATTPTGPTVGPAPGKSYRLFADAEIIGEHYAGAKIAAQQQQGLWLGQVGRPQTQAQSQYNLAYAQCTFSRGNDLPGCRHLAGGRR